MNHSTHESPLCAMHHCHRPVQDAVWQNAAIIIQVSALLESKIPSCNAAMAFQYSRGTLARNAPEKQQQSLCPGEGSFPDQVKAQPLRREKLCTRCSARCSVSLVIWILFLAVTFLQETFCRTSSQTPLARYSLVLPSSCRIFGSLRTHLPVWHPPCIGTTAPRH